MNSRTKIKQEPVRERVEQPIEVGGLIGYYREGWRTGTLEEIKGKLAKIIPLGGKANKRGVWVAMSNVRPYES